MIVSCPRCTQAVTASRTRPEALIACAACDHRFYGFDCHHQAENFVIYDLETTGLDPSGEDIIQIAAMRFTAGRLRPAETYSSFAKPRKPISAFIQQYTGITNRHVAGAPRPEAVLLEFAEWSGDATLIAHNGLRFDSKFLQATCEQHGMPMRAVGGIDSIHISKMLYGNAPGTGHALDRLVERLAIDTEGVARHDARGDVEILGYAVARMWTHLSLDAAFNGVRRHEVLLPRSGALGGLIQ